MSTCIVIFTTVVPLYYSITVNNCTLLVSFGDFCFLLLVFPLSLDKS